MKGLRASFVWITIATLSASATANDNQQSMDTWRFIGIDSVLVNTGQLSQSACTTLCRSPGTCIRHRAGTDSFACTYTCQSDTWCPFGSICLCSDPTRCAATPTQLPWIPAEFEGLCAAIDRARNRSESRRRYLLAIRGAIERPHPPELITQPDPDKCPEGFDTHFGTCVRSCSETHDCPRGMFCYASRCINDCTDRVCPKGYRCVGTGISLSGNSKGPTLPYCSRIWSKQ